MRTESDWVPGNAAEALRVASVCLGYLIPLAALYGHKGMPIGS